MKRLRRNILEYFLCVHCKHSSLTSSQTQRYVRIYDLSKQELLKKLQSSAKWISSMAIHPKGLFTRLLSHEKSLLIMMHGKGVSLTSIIGPH